MPQGDVSLPVAGIERDGAFGLRSGRPLQLVPPARGEEFAVERPKRTPDRRGRRTGLEHGPRSAAGAPVSVRPGPGRWATDPHRRPSGTGRGSRCRRAPGRPAAAWRRTRGSRPAWRRPGPERWRPGRTASPARRSTGRPSGVRPRPAPSPAASRRRAGWSPPRMKVAPASLAGCRPASPAVADDIVCTWLAVSTSTVRSVITPASWAQGRVARIHHERLDGDPHRARRAPRQQASRLPDPHPPRTPRAAGRPRRPPGS